MTPGIANIIILINFIVVKHQILTTIQSWTKIIIIVITIIDIKEILTIIPDIIIIIRLGVPKINSWRK